MQKPAGRSLLQEWRKLSKEVHAKGVGKDILKEVGEQQKEKPVKCKWCAEKSMEKHGEHMKEIQKVLLKRRVEAEASPLKRTNGDAAIDKTNIIFEEEVETKRMKKQVSFAGVTSIVQVTDTDCSKSFKREMQTAGRSN